VAEDLVFERGEGMLDRAPSQPHLVGCCTLLHPVQDFVVQMACDQTLRGFGAAILQRTVSAVVRLCLVIDGAISTRQREPLQRFAFGTEEAVGLRLIEEGAAVQQ
jgi:hypothetical protein